MKKTKAALILALILAVSSGCLPSQAAEEPIEISFLTSAPEMPPRRLKRIWRRGSGRIFPM